jgi:hypothetical protein
MSVYVGIDVHRKRSQVAVVAEDGKVQLGPRSSVPPRLRRHTPRSAIRRRQAPGL